MKKIKLEKILPEERGFVRMSLYLSADVVDDLTIVAFRRAFAGCEALARAYIEQGLREDLAKADQDTKLNKLIHSLRNQGVNDEILASAMADVTG